ncbi:MAG: hypothetical protein CSA66_00735 [Proteobacteria bacterium]|nr:MAG: hypothetical protein CSA66_00735 [Pseudomonadota bacterium]
MRLIVTTTPAPPPRLVARARAVAQRCGARYAPRSGTLARTVRRAGGDLAYVVARGREQLQDGAEVLYVHPGMFYYKRGDGRRHPLIRALAPAAAAPLTRVVDATLGLAGDALHAASVLGVEVAGVEGSPVLASLLEEGLARLAAEGAPWSAGAARVSVAHGGGAEVLAGMAAHSADAVYLDPMFDVPLSGPPGLSLLRRVAVTAPLSEALVAQAWRVAARRVVLKLPGRAAPPKVTAGPGWNRRVRGKAVDYLVIEAELQAPEYEAPDLGSGSH